MDWVASRDGMQEDDCLTIDCRADALVDELGEVADLPLRRFEHIRYSHRPLGRCEHGVGTVAVHYFQLKIGGADRVALELVKLFASMGMRVILYTDVAEQPGDCPMPEGVIRKHVAHSADEPRERMAYWRREMRDEHIDAMVYNSWLARPVLIDCLAVQSAGALFIYHTHGNAAHWMFGDDAARTERCLKTAFLADAILALSEADQAFWRLFNDATDVVVNPVELYAGHYGKRAGLPSEKQVLWCGRIAPEKRPLEAIRIMGALSKYVPDAKMDVVGGGDDALFDEMKALARELGVEDRVSFEGPQQDMLPYFQKASVFIMTSETEGFPLALAEAMQQGVPCVIYDLPCLTLVSHGGVVRVPQFDCEQAAEALAALLTDKDLQAQCGAQARRAYEQVCCVDQVGRWHSVFAHAAAHACLDEGCLTQSDSLREAMYSALAAHDGHVARRDARIGALEQENEALVIECDAIGRELLAWFDSKTFKVSRAVTALPRAVSGIFSQR